MKPFRILFVCQGNIIRSPLAEALFRERVQEAGLEEKYEVDSAGTSGYHVGEHPDRRMVQAAGRHGLQYDHRSRQVDRKDFDRFDLLIALDHENRSDLVYWALKDEHRQKIRLLREFDPNRGKRVADVPDPYYGGADGFEEVYHIVDSNTRAWLDALEKDEYNRRDPVERDSER